MQKRMLRKTTGWLLKGMLTLLSLLILAVVLVSLSGRLQTRLTSLVVKKINRQHELNMSIGSLAVKLPASIELHDVFIPDTRNDTLLSAEILKLRLRLFPAVLRKDYEVRSFYSYNSRIKLYSSDENAPLNVEELLQRFGSATEEKTDSVNNEQIRFNIREIDLLNTRFSYYTILGQDSTGINSGKIRIRIRDLDLDGRNIDLSRILVEDSDIHLRTGKKIKSEKKGQAFPGPWQIAISDITLKENRFTYRTSHTSDTLNTFDPDNFSLSHVSANLENVVLRRNLLATRISQLSLLESKGFMLKDLSSEVQLDSSSMQLKKFKLTTPDSRINAGFYAAMDIFGGGKLIRNNTAFQIAVSNSWLSAYDLKSFVGLSGPGFPDLLMHDAAVEISARIKGSPRKAEYTLSLKNSDLFDLNLTGQASGLLNKESRTLDMQELSLSLDHILANELIRHFGDSNMVVFPADIALNGKMKLQPDSLLSEFTLDTGEDLLDMQFDLTELREELPSWEIRLKGSNLDPEKYFTNRSQLHISDISLQSDITGKGFDKENLYSTGSFILTKITLNEVRYENIVLDYSYRDKLLHAGLNSQDRNYRGLFRGSVDLSSDIPLIDADADISFLNMKDILKDSTDLLFNGHTAISVKGTGPDQLQVSLNIDSSMIMLDERRLFIRQLSAEGETDSIHSRFSVGSELLDATFEGEMAIRDIPEMLTGQFISYLHPDDSQYESDVKKDYSLDLRMENSNWLQQLLGKELPVLDDLEVSSSFKSMESTGRSSITLSRLYYNGARVDSLAFSHRTQTGSENFTLTTDSLSYKANKFSKINLEGRMDRENITAAFKLYGLKDDILLGMNGKLKKQDSSAWTFSLLKDGLILDNERWTVNSDNRIELIGQQISTSNLSIMNKDQQISLTGSKTSPDRHPLELNLENIDLSSLFKIVNQQAEGITGKLDGDLTAFSTRRMLDSLSAGIVLKELVFEDQPVGQISMAAKSRGANNLGLDLLYSDMGNSIRVAGSIHPDDRMLDMLLTIDSLNMSLFSPLISDQVSRLSGNISGKASMKGNMKDPTFSGSLKLNQLTFLPLYLKVPMKIQQGDIGFTNNEVRITDLELRDSLGNISRMNGRADIENYRIGNTELELTSGNFLFLNTGRKDNPLFFGKIFLDSRLQITGRPEDLKVKVDARVNKGSEITLILPDAPRIIEENDLVIFVSSAEIQADSSLVSNATWKRKKTAFDIDATLSINNETGFRIILDEYTGDYLSFNGSASNLKYSLKQGAQHNLAGKYEIEKGKYHATFFEFTSRNFDISEGSSITWTGNPVDALIDIKTVYSIKTSPLPLLENEELNQAVFEKNTFKKPERFHVNLEIKNQLQKPDLKFAIESAEKDDVRQYDVLNSTLYRLNNSPNELNKQVFGLLLFGQFLPQNSWLATSDKSMFMDKVEEQSGKYLSNYINSFAGKNIPWFDLETQVDLSSSDKPGLISEAEIGIELSKQLFNQRLLVVVGEKVNLQNDPSSPFNTDNLGGDVKIEYLITKDGSIKLETSRRKNSKSIIDGELIENSIGITFSKKFSKKRAKK